MLTTYHILATHKISKYTGLSDMIWIFHGDCI